jgi:MYXO-CTERM domain-containing protein
MLSEGSGGGAGNAGGRTGQGTGGVAPGGAGGAATAGTGGDAGCSCSFADASTPRAAWLVAIVLPLAVQRRRRPIR